MVDDVTLGTMPRKVSHKACLHEEVAQNICQGIGLLQSLSERMLKVSFLFHFESGFS